MIISRYVTKEVLINFLGITGVLLFIALSNKFIFFLAKAAKGEISLGFVIKIVGLYIPEILAMLLPLALFIAILFSYSRMYADSEAVVLFSCGFSWKKLISITLNIAFIIAFLSLGLLNYIVPNTLQYREQILQEGQAYGVFNAITPGRFQTIDEGKIVFYAEDVDSNNNLNKVFIAEQPKILKNKLLPGVFITSDSALITTKSNKQIDKEDHYLVLKNGHKYSGSPGEADYEITEFKTYGKELLFDNKSIAIEKTKTKNSLDLLKSNKKEDRAEFLWRVSLPLSVLILAIIAIPLSKIRPRQGRFANFFPAILIYIVYLNTMTLVKRWFESGALDNMMYMGLLHFIFLAFGAIMIFINSGKLKEFLYENFK